MAFLAMHFATHGALIVLVALLAHLWKARRQGSAYVPSAAGNNPGVVLLAVAVPAQWVLLPLSLQALLLLCFIAGAWLLLVGDVLLATPRVRVATKLCNAGTALTLAGCGLLASGLIRAFL